MRRVRSFADSTKYNGQAGCYGAYTRTSGPLRRHVLEKVNFRVDVASNGGEACRLFADSREGTYQAVLMGIYVPAAYMTAKDNGDGTYTCTVNKSGTVGSFTGEDAPMTDDSGAAISDAICGAMCWCPVTSLDIADEAYEWMMGQCVTTDTRADGTFTAALSKDMAAVFADYINKLGLTDSQGNALTLSSSASGVDLAGTYYDYIKSTIETSLNNFLSDTTFPYTPSSQSSVMGGMGVMGGGGRPTMSGAPSDMETDIQGYDIDPRAVKAARENAEAAGVAKMIHFQARAVRDLSHPKKYGFLFANPPYGERIEERENLPELYKELGEAYARLDTWSMYIISAYEDAERYIGRKADKNRKLYNGMVYRRGVSVGIATIVGIIGIIAIVALGYVWHPLNFNYTVWMVLLGVYILIASVTPVWILLQPRDYLSSFLLYFMT